MTVISPGYLRHSLFYQLRARLVERTESEIQGCVAVPLRIRMGILRAGIIFLLSSSRFVSFRIKCNNNGIDVFRGSVRLILLCDIRAR